jgi:hypothetical protein
LTPPLNPTPRDPTPRPPPLALPNIQVIVILVPTLLLGAFATRRRSWPAAWGLAAVLMYPLALLLQFLLMHVAKMGR